MEILSPSSLHVSFVSHEDYLEALITGLASPDGAQAVLAQAGAEATRSKSTRVLLNCLDILGQTAPYDHHLLGVTLARHLRGVRCALVTSPAKIRGVMGRAAKAEGAEYQAFSDLGQAVLWLRS